MNIIDKIEDGARIEHQQTIIKCLIEQLEAQKKKSIDKEELIRTFFILERQKQALRKEV